MAISILTAKKMLKSAGAERVSDEAAMELAETINKFAYVVAKKAVMLAKHASRKTVKKADVQLAK
jgi:DNA-binding protein